MSQNNKKSLKKKKITTRTSKSSSPKQRTIYEYEVPIEIEKRYNVETINAKPYLFNKPRYEDQYFTNRIIP